MAEDQSINCPECGEFFSRREARRRDQHMLQEHGSVLVWTCTQCEYTTTTRRRHDHTGHWGRRHQGRPQFPSPRLRPVEQSPPRHKPSRRRPSSSPSREVRRRTSPPLKSRVSRRQPATSTRLQVSVSKPPDSPDQRMVVGRDQSARRTPRKSPTPRKVEGRQVTPHREAAALESPPRLPSPAASCQESLYPEVIVHTHDEGEFEEPHSPQQDLSTGFEAALTFVEREADQEQCRQLRDAAETRFPDLRPTPPAPLPAETRLTWHPSGGLSLDVGGLHVVAEGPITETRLGPQK